jgi:hypothetical protein
MKLQRHFWLTIELCEEEGEFNPSTIAFLSVTSDDLAKVSPDYLKDKILAFLRTEFAEANYE